MKVLLLCMAFAAVTLAMPVAEEKQEVPIAPPTVPEVKSEDVKPTSDAQLAKVELTKSVPEPETIISEKLEEAAPKSVAPIDSAPEIQPDAKIDSVPEVKKGAIPETKATLPETPAPEKILEVALPADNKPEEKSAQPENEPIKESKSEETQAKVEEVKVEPSAKSALPDDIIDISAVLKPAAIADDVMDPTAVAPVIAVKSADPEEKKTASPVADATSVKAAQPEENSSINSKPEDKPSEAAAALDTPASSKSVVVPDDSARIVRDAIEEQKEPEAQKIEAKTVAEAIPEEIKSTEVQKIEPKSGEVQIAVEQSPSPKTDLSNDATIKASDAPKEKEVAAPVQPEDAKEAKSAVKPEEPLNEMLNDAPANEKSSEESGESAEKNDSADKNSSEESGEKSKESKP